MSSKSVFLDVDSSIVENNLKITDPQEEEFNKLFGAPPDVCPSKLVKPFPGFCVKTKEVATEKKLFINICYTDAIPSPKDITENELKDLLSSDDLPDFKVPMSIGEIRTENDKKNEKALICDVAIHPTFFKKIDNSELFKNFFLTIVFEGIKNKYGIISADEKIVLKNRKAFGTLQMHRIQQREIAKEMGTMELDKQQITNNNNKPAIQIINSSENVNREPEYRLYIKKVKPDCLYGEFKFPDIISSKNINLNIGEDRILIEAPIKNYFLDIFIPYIIRQKACSANFDKTTKILLVKMSLVGG